MTVEHVATIYRRAASVTCGYDGRMPYGKELTILIASSALAVLAGCRRDETPPPPPQPADTPMTTSCLCIPKT